MVKLGTNHKVCVVSFTDFSFKGYNVSHFGQKHVPNEWSVKCLGMRMLYVCLIVTQRIMGQWGKLMKTQAHTDNTTTDRNTIVLQQQLRMVVKLMQM